MPPLAEWWRSVGKPEAFVAIPTSIQVHPEKHRMSTAKITSTTTLIPIWLACSAFLALGLTRPIIEISVNVESVLRDAINQQPVIGLLLQEKGFKLSDIASKLPPTSTTTQSIFSSATKLFSLRCYSAAIVIILFSIVTPIAKQGVFLCAILFPKNLAPRYVMLTKVLHKWAMVDVFVLAMVVLTLSSAAAWSATILDGFYWFLVYFVLAAILGFLVSSEHPTNPAR